MIGIRQTLLAAGAAALLALAAAGPANAAADMFKPPNYTFPDGFKGFSLQSHGGGDFNPGVLVGFNPQPDPPGDFVGFTPPGGGGDPTMIDLHNPGDPLLFNPADGGTFNFLIALLDLGDGSVMPGDPAAPPNGDGLTHFHTLDGGHDISIFMAFGGSPVGSWSWATFNPQPDPPGDFIGGSIGFAGDPFMAFHIEIDGHPLTFSLTPEPGTWGLMIAGFAGAGLMLRRARRGAAA